jgi:hypothetical protein
MIDDTHPFDIFDYLHLGIEGSMEGGRSNEQQQQQQQPQQPQQEVRLEAVLIWNAFSLQKIFINKSCFFSYHMQMEINGMKLFHQIRQTV